MTPAVPTHRVSVVTIEGWFADCSCGWTGESHPYQDKELAIVACADHLRSIVWPQPDSVAERLDALEASLPESQMRDLLAQVMVDPYLAASGTAGWRDRVSRLLDEAHG